ncbi:MAG: hypothetical protein KGP01_05840 [Actinomycetales bacterium]|nr:hypothetical protein [Actinomycetales bacterium]
MTPRTQVRAGATGIGSIPADLAARGRITDPRETARVVADACPDLPHLVELPGRGAGADMVGRTAAMLAAVSSDFAVHTVPTGWRRTARPGVDLERASRWLDQDFDAVAEVYADYAGPFKLQVCGPLTWCRVVEDSSGEPSLRDAGFVTDVVSAVAEAAAAQVARVRRLVPGVTTVVVQVDEPAFTQVLRGDVRTASGRGRVSPPDPQRAGQWFSSLTERIRAASGMGKATQESPATEWPATTVAAVSGEPLDLGGPDTVAASSTSALALWLHSCADSSHIAPAVRAGFDAVSFDLSRTPASALDDVGTAHDAGLTLVTGVVTPADWPLAQSQMTRAAHARAERLRAALSIPAQEFPAGVTLTPACGLAGASPQQARTAMAVVFAAARSVAGETMPTDEV